MNITRNNYEEFFMLYADNELTAAQRKTVEAFITANPDLRAELALFQQFKLQPDEEITFDQKASLLKQASDSAFVNLANYESFFVLYADNELTNADRTLVEEFVRLHPAIAQAFALFQQARLMPDSKLVFQNKESLYRYEEDDKVVPFPWWRMAVAAAAVLFVAGIFWLNKDRQPDQQVVIKNNPGQQIMPPATQIVTAKIPAVVDSSESPAKQILAATNNKKQPTVKTTRSAMALVKHQHMQQNSNTLQGTTVTDQTAAKPDRPDLKNATVSATPAHLKTVEIKRPVPAAAATALPDQPAIILNPDENEKIQYASFTTDNIEVLNTSVNTKSALRGFLRKASRLIAKKTDDGGRKRILVGSFEIPVQ